jgi:hypothetical protein
MRLLRDCAALIVLLSIAARAELPPDVYRKLQSSAPEALTITVQEAKVATSGNKDVKISSITAKARVGEVSRSASGLKPGDVIEISYEHRMHKVPLAGPSEPTIIEKGRTYPAFLRKDNGRRYSLAARGYSFRKLD